MSKPFRINGYDKEITNLDDFKKAFIHFFMNANINVNLFGKYKLSKNDITEKYFEDYFFGTDNNGNNNYLNASYLGYLDIMKYIVNITPNISKIYCSNVDKRDAYLLAALNGKQEIMEYLIKEHNWEVNVIDKYGYDAYDLAELNNHSEIMKYLEKEHNWKNKNKKFHKILISKNTEKKTNSIPKKNNNRKRKCSESLSNNKRGTVKLNTGGTDLFGRTFL